MKIKPIIALLAFSPFVFADVTVYGSLEQSIEYDNGSTNIVNGDSFIGFSAYESIGSMSVSANMSFDANTQSSSTALATKDSYVGVNTTVGNVTIGRQKNLTKVVGDVVDIFEGNGHSVINQTRVDNAIAYSKPFAIGVTIGAMVSDNATDTNEMSVMYSNGAITMGGSYHNAESSDTDTYTVVSALDYGNMFAGVARSIVDNVSAPNTTEMTYSAMYTIGSNDLKVGYQNSDTRNDLTTFEAVHNISSNASMYINHQITNPTDDNATDVSAVGLRMNF